MDEEPLKFATADDLRARWPDMPSGSDEHANVLLEDASQFMIDAYPTCMQASANTRKRIVCAVVRRAMQTDADSMVGLESIQVGTGPFQDTAKPVNPHGDYYLTEQEIRSLGLGKGRKQSAFQIDMLAVPDAAQGH